VVYVACDCPCDSGPGFDPRRPAAGGQGPIHRGCFWRSRLITDLLWQSWTSDVPVTSDDHLGGSIHGDIAVSGVPILERWAGLIN
jgi:hypothetical protein